MDGIAAAASVIVVSPVVRFRLSSSFGFRVCVRAPCQCVREREREPRVRESLRGWGWGVSLLVCVLRFPMFSSSCSVLYNNAMFSPAVS